VPCRAVLQVPSFTRSQLALTTLATPSFSFLTHLLLRPLCLGAAPLLLQPIICNFCYNCTCPARVVNKQHAAPPAGYAPAEAGRRSISRNFHTRASLIGAFADTSNYPPDPDIVADTDTALLVPCPAPLHPKRTDLDERHFYTLTFPLDQRVYTRPPPQQASISTRNSSA
jgi:hypothetical protein